MWFNIVKGVDGKSSFELDNIHLLVDGFTVDNNHHYFVNPEKAIAYFNINNELYSVSNRFKLYKTAEEFYEVMKKQLAFFKKK